MLSRFFRIAEHQTTVKKLLMGQHRVVSPVMYVLTGLFLLALVLA